MAAHWSDSQEKAAKARGEALLAAELRATAVHYDPTSGRIVVDLTNGCAFAFLRLVEELHGAKPAEVARVE